MPRNKSVEVENIGLCIGPDGCTPEDVFQVLQKPEGFQTEADRSSITPLETLNKMVLEWIQLVTSNRSFLLYFIYVLEESDCGDMAAHLREHFDLQFNAPNSCRGIRKMCDVNEEDVITIGNYQNRCFHSIPPLALACPEEKPMLDVPTPILPDGMDTTSRGLSRYNQLSHWMFHTLQLFISIGLLAFSIISLNSRDTSLMRCPTTFKHLSWLNVTSFREYESLSYSISPEEGIKLNIRISSLHDWPPGSILWNPCNIVELHLSGTIDDLILISLSQQLHQTEVITVKTKDCLDNSEAYVSTKQNYRNSFPRKPTKIKKICIQPNAIFPSNKNYESITVSSYEEYKQQLSGIPPNVLMDVTLNLSESSAWPTTLGGNDLLRVKKLTLMGPFPRKSLISILKHAKETEELYIFDSVAGLCEKSTMWDLTNKPPDIRSIIDLVNLKILGFENFEKCSNIYNLFGRGIRTVNLHTFKLENCSVSDSNLGPIQTFLKTNSRSLEKLKFVLRKWNVSLFQDLNTNFPKISDLEIDFVSGDQVTNFISGLLCDEVFPFLTKLVLTNGYLSYDDVNIILKCNKLNYLDFDVWIQKGMEPLRMNILKSVIRLPQNFTLGLFFDGKSPSDYCKVELITGIDFLPNCQILEVDS